MALSRVAGLCRLALRTQWAAVRLLSAVGEPIEGEDRPGRRIDLEALQRERALRPPAALAQPHKVHTAHKSSYEQRKLNLAIKDSESVDAVLDHVTAGLALIDHVGISSAFYAIAKLNRGPAGWLKEDARFKQLMLTARSLMKHKAMDAFGYSNMLYACGQLGVVPPPSWLQVFWHSSALVLGDFVEQGLSNTLYSCGELGIAPPIAWLESFWHASATKLGNFKPQGLSNMLHACGQRRMMPPADWLQRFWHASALKMVDFNGQNFANTLYACGHLGIVPHAVWLQRFWHASAAKLGVFNSQDFSNTLYACGQLSIMPTGDWLQRFWHASAAKLGDFKPQALSNTLYACGQLGVTPPTPWLQRFWHASASNLDECIPQNFSNTIYACALLDSRPPDGWLHSFSESFQRSLPDANPQELANTALALAILGLWELPLWPGLWEHLCHAMPSETANWTIETRNHARQLYQAYQMAAMERPGLLPPPDPALLAASRKSWINGMADNSSRLHAEVSTCLARMGIAHANERWCERAERSIDIAIEGAAPVALEVDGPTHFLHDGRPTGSTRQRNRMLVAHGWRVVVVDFRAWENLSGDVQREEYLRRLLA